MTNFDERASDWDKNQQRVDRARVFAEAIRQRIPSLQTKSALEYGSGTGLLSFALQPYLSQITCADSSSGMLAKLEEKVAAANVSNIKTLKLDLESDPPPAERFSLVYALMVLHHVRDTVKILKSFHSLLDDPGYLCIGDLDQEDGSFHTSDFEGHQGFDRDQLAALCRQVGLRNVSSSIIFTMSKSQGDVKKPYPLFLLVAQKS